MRSAPWYGYAGDKGRARDEEIKLLRRSQSCASRWRSNPTGQEPRVEEPAPEPLTLGAGAALAFDPARGVYPTKTEPAREARRLAERGAAILGRKLT